MRNSDPTTRQPAQIGPRDARGRYRGRGRHLLAVAVDGQSCSDSFSGTSENISCGGLFITTEAIYEPGEELLLKLRLGRRDEPDYTATVRWRRPRDPATGLPSGIGVSFDRMPRAQRRELKAIVDGFDRRRRLHRFRRGKEDTLRGVELV